MSESLYTLTGPCTHEVEIKKSRFLAQAAPVDTPEAAMAFLDKARQADANHDCWAYRIGQAYRFNDDGEPSGSAGKPILAAIDGQHLDGVVAVVTRWFGGIKLGIGGLIRAYGGTAAECLRRAETVPIIAKTRVTLTCGYAEWPLIKARIQPMQVTFHGEDFGAGGVHVTLDVPDQQVPSLKQLVADATHGQGRIIPLDIP